MVYKTTMKSSQRQVVLCILDGWGLGDASPDNAITNANPIFFNHLLETYPTSKLYTSGEKVGLPEGQMGNSEVGHMTIGSGRIIEQDLLKINRLFESDQFFKKTQFLEYFDQFDKEKNVCHVVGLLSDGGVHSHINHIFSIVSFLNDHKIRSCLHVITDGRDTLPKSGIKFLNDLETHINDKPYITIATISGRYYAMDRDKRQERTELAYDAIAYGNNKTFDNAEDAIILSYAEGLNDEFIIPQSSKNYSGVSAGDRIVFMNFRPDRMRQIVSSFKGSDAKIITMTSYSQDISSFASVLIKEKVTTNTLSEVLSNQEYSMSQLRIAETEKYAHVTFFFNAGIESPYPNEKRILINSPKVATYDLKPEMSAYELTDRLVSEIESAEYNFIVVNYANADMVGHTGNYQATIDAIRHIDKCLKKLSETILKKNGILIITADHGNAEIMFDNVENSPYTSHTTNPVPFIVVSNDLTKGNCKLNDGTLADIAPTILALFDIKVPKEMTGTNLIA